MSQIKVNQISGDVENTPVHFPQGLSGDGSNMLFPPEILTFTPVPGAININVGSNIVVTFDQPIQFSVGVGTIKIRKNSVSGTVHESYATGSSGNLTISNNQLTINPSTDLDPFSTYFLEIPNVGVANTMGVSYKGNSESPYKFTTANGIFGATGGFTHTTGGYKYHVFLGTGPLNFDYHTKHAGNITLMLVGGGGGGAGNPASEWAAGGGGGGGVVVQRNFKLPEGDYNITIGAGGGGSGTGSPQYYGQNGNDTYLEYGPTHPQYTPNGDDRNIFRAYGGGGGLYSYPTVPTSFVHATKGSGGGMNGYYALDKPTFNYGIKNADGYGGRNMPGQGNRGGGSQGQPLGPNGQNGPDRGRQTSGGGGGAGQPGLTWSPYPNPPNPNYPGSRSGYGGDGLAVPEFGWGNWGPHMNPNILPVPGTQWSEWSTYVLYGSVDGSRTGIGPQGYYGGGGGGGSARQPNPSHPAHENYMTAGRGGRGGGGHGYRTYTPISGYGAPVYSPTHPQRPNISTIYPGPENYAADGAIYTGGGGGGTSGPAPSYHAGRGATGVAMLRYPV